MQLSSFLQLPVINLNIIIAVALVLGGVYGLIAGKQRLRLLILSVYVGIVLSSQLTDTLKPMVHMLTNDQLGWALLAVPILTFGFFGMVHAKNHAKGVAIANIVVGILTAALITATVFKLLPTSQLAAVNQDSFLAINLLQFYPWLLGLLPLVALVLGFIKGEKSHRA